MSACFSAKNSIFRDLKLIFNGSKDQRSITFNVEIWLQDRNVDLVGKEDSGKQRVLMIRVFNFYHQILVCLIFTHTKGATPTTTSSPGV